MYVVIEKDTGKIVWASAPAVAGFAGPARRATAAAREFAAKNPGKSYYAAFLYLEVVTGKTEERTSWGVEK